MAWQGNGLLCVNRPLKFHDDLTVVAQPRTIPDSPIFKGQALLLRNTTEDLIQITAKP